MRIIKMSVDVFETLDVLIQFFQEDLPAHDPPGKFRIPKGRIAEDCLAEREPLLFSYESSVVYTARAASGRCKNRDECSDEYPFYFLVDMETVRRVDVTLVEVEDRLRATGVRKHIVHSQGWPTIPDSPERTGLWLSLRGERDLSKATE